MDCQETRDKDNIFNIRSIFTAVNLLGFFVYLCFDNPEGVWGIVQQQESNLYIRDHGGAC